MNDEPDPALQFFPDGKVDLYGALGIKNESTQEEIKKAYRKAALKYHPDKQKGDETEKQASSMKFQQIGYAYAVLSTPARKARYDSTGKTDESMFEESMDWNAYFKELWTGEVNADTLDEFKKKYQGSKDEREDILEAFKATEGHLAEMVDHIPYMSLRLDRERVEKVIEEAIEKKQLTRTKQWDKTRKDKRLIKQAEQKEETEEVEAMEMAREMGVYDALFGDEATKANSRANGKGKAQKRKQEDDEESNLTGLQNLIAKRNKNRGNQMDNLIAKLEAEASSKKSKRSGSGKKKGKKEEQEEKGPTTEPSEEEFARIQASIDAKRNKKVKAR